LLKQISGLLDLDALTVSGQMIGRNIETARVFNDRVIRSLEHPVSSSGGTAVLYGNLAPNGAVIKPTAAEPRLLKHTGPAVVFKDYADLEARIDDKDLPVHQDSVLVLQNAGPLGGPGMPEWGMLPIPRRLLAQGVRDMVRISDARMSGTSYGACVLHVSPESYVGGPLAFVHNGDLIELDVAERRLELRVDGNEMGRRRASWQPRPAHYERGFGALYAAHVTQAERGCDFDFLEAGAETAEPEIY
jgi:dihydroxy-acid dehydratase